MGAYQSSTEHQSTDLKLATSYTKAMEPLGQYRLTKDSNRVLHIALDQWVLTGWFFLHAAFGYIVMDNNKHQNE